MAHSHPHMMTERRIGLSVCLTLLFVLGEAAAGYFAHSLALMSDAGHNFADALALVFSWYALSAARRPAHSRRTFGYHRVGIMAALVNAVSLVVIALLIFWEALQRLHSPQPVAGPLMVGIALVALALNAAIAFGLHGHAQHDLNVRSAYLHMLGDAASAFLVVIAGAVVALTGSPVADPLVSFVIGALILWSSWGVLSETVNVLLEAAPAGMDMQAVEQCIEEIAGVRSAHDLHVWTVASGILACSCHILVDEQSVSSGEQVIRSVVRELERRFGINHTTVQVEVEGCDPTDMYCTMRALSHGHTHAGGGHTHCGDGEQHSERVQ